MKSVGSAMGGGMCEKCWQSNGRWYVWAVPAEHHVCVKPRTRDRVTHRNCLSLSGLDVVLFRVITSSYSRQAIALVSFDCLFS